MNFYEEGETIPRQEPARLSLEERVRTFKEVVLPFTEEQALAGYVLERIDDLLDWLP